MTIETRNNLALIDPESIDRIVVIGDIHGDLKSYESGVDHWNEKGVLLFLGDFADRGPRGVEVIEGVLDLTERYPDQVVALKGNHEDYSPDGRPLFSPCTLIDEAGRKRGGWDAFFPTLRRLIQRLHLTAFLPGRSLFVHGGVCENVDSLDTLAEPDPECARNLLWSDPGQEPGTSINFRGAGKVFGPDVTAHVLASLGASSILRGHQPQRAVSGPLVEHEDRIVTVGSTRVYGSDPFILDLPVNDYPQTRAQFKDCAVFL